MHEETNIGNLLESISCQPWQAEENDGFWLIKNLNGIEVAGFSHEKDARAVVEIFDMLPRLLDEFDETRLKLENYECEECKGLKETIEKPEAKLETPSGEPGNKALIARVNKAEDKLDAEQNRSIKQRARIKELETGIRELLE